MRTEATQLLGTKEKSSANQAVHDWCMKASLECHLDSFLQVECYIPSSQQSQQEESAPSSFEGLPFQD